MTAKTGKHDVDEVEAVPAGEESAAGEAEEAEEEQAEQERAEQERAEDVEVAERPAKPKRRRRVRVIEVIDDEDLDEVLEALDAEDERAEAEEEPPARPARAAKPAVATAKPKAKPASRPASKASTTAKPRPSRLDPPEEREDEHEDEPPAKAPARPSAVSLDERPAIFGLGVPQAVVVVVLVALLASLGIWQWRSASSLSGEQDQRDAVAKVASAYGDVALNYNAQNYQSQMAKAQKLMGGDLLESFKSTTLPSLGETFKNNPELSLTSKTNQVFVGTVDDRFASAVVMVDIDVRTKDGATAAPATLLRLALAKIDGSWKVTKQYASGTNDQNQNQQQGQLPSVPSGSPSPKAEKSGKPGD